MTRTLRTSAMLVLMTIGAALAGDTAPVRDHTIVSDDYFTIAQVTGCKVSPDGRFVAYTETRWDESEDKRNTDLWVVATDTREPTRLTFDPAGDGSPQWSPDAKWIYFTSSRKRPGEEKPPYNGETQVWRIRPDGGEPFPVTRLEDGVQGYQLSHDGRTLYYTVTEEEVDDDPWKSLRKEFKELEYGHGVVNVSQIWKLDLIGWRSEKLIDEKRVIGEFVVSPDEQRIAMITTPTEELITNEGQSHVDIYDATTKKVTTLQDDQWRGQAPSPYGWILGLAWSGDSRSIAFRVDFDGYPGEIFVAQFRDTEHSYIQKITRPNEIFLTGHMEWLPGGNDLGVMADDHGRTRVYRLHGVQGGGQGKTTTLTPGNVCVDTFNFTHKGDRMAFVMSTVTHPPDVFVTPTTGRADVKYDRITRVNPQVDTWKLPKIEIVKWKSTDGTQVEGILELPPDYKPGDAPLPMVVEIHGGPTAASKLRFRFWIYGRVLLPARGWALLSPNYRGSTGYGDKFLVDLIGHKNDRDVQDILTGTDAMIERGIADPDRLAVMGWSNGGFLTNCLITTTDRFKAASSGAGVFDVVMQWLTEDTPGHVINYNEGLPWNKTDQMRRSSPLYNVHKVKTPTLIHVGENDPRCPPGHSRGLFRALHHYLDVPCELVVYTGAGHGLTKFTHRKAKMEWDLAWFDHHVLGKTTEDSDSEPSQSID